MKWAWFVMVTVACWGAYVPILHSGQQAFPQKPAALRAFLFVGLAYLIVSIAVLLYLQVTKAEPMQLSSRGVSQSTVAGILGAIGALGIVFAIKNGGKPIVVAPLVFAGAPIINTIVSMIWHKPAKAPHLLFFVGILVAGGGAALVLKFRPQ